MQPRNDADPYARIACRLIPFLPACYFIAVIDSFNVGFAKLEFLRDLKLDDAVFGLAASIFYVGYVALEVSSNLLLVRVGVRKTLLRIMVLRGLCYDAARACAEPVPFYILRFLLRTP